MGRNPSLAPHHAAIVAMYENRATRAEIAKAFGAKYRTVERYMEAQGMPARPLRHTEIMNNNQKKIAKLRAKKVKHKDIAAELGVTENQVRAYCGRMKIVSYSKNHVPRGRFSFLSFSLDDLATLGEMAHAWECADLSEAIVELVRDAIAVQQAKTQKKRA
jgi:DNA-binding CsgD family transcriptional regulator